MKRLQRAKEEVMLYDKYDYFLLNEEGKIEECVRQLEIIAEAQTYRTKNTPDFPEKFFNS